MPTLFVTAFYVPPGDLPKERVDGYIAHGGMLVRAGVVLMIYTTTDLAELMRVAWSSLNLGRVEFVTDVPMEDYWQAAPALQLPEHRNQEKDTAFYLSVQLTKLKACADAARRRPDFRLIAWLDFRLFHVIQSVDVAQTVLQTISWANDVFTEKIVSPGGYDPPGSAESRFSRICWRNLGGVLVGHRQAFGLAYEEQRRLVEENMPRLTWEVNYWAMMPQHFHLYPADHNDTILTGLLGPGIFSRLDGTRRPSFSRTGEQ